MMSKRKEGFSNYMSSVLQNSMLTGIPQIAAAGNAPKRVLRAVVFVMCVGGFVYQSLSFMGMYFKYETVIDIQVENPREIELPSITFCNYNGLMSSKICNDSGGLSNKCISMATQNYANWCNCVPRLCKNGQVMDMKKAPPTLLSEMTYWEYDEYKKFLQTIDDLLIYCSHTLTTLEEILGDCNLTYFHNVRCPSARSDVISSCYTINSLVGLPEGVQPMVLSNGWLIMMLETRPEEYGIDVKIVSTQISFHHPRTILNPYNFGTTMYPGTETIFRLKKTIKNLLPAPYETNCKDYTAEWKSRGGYGPTNEKECIEECQKNASIKARGCIEEWYLVPGNERRCDGMTLEVLKSVHACQLKNCRPACYEETYQVSKDVQDSKNMPGCEDKSMFRNRATVNLKFNGMETTTYTYYPKYQNIETFSYVGGYVGMWLGISLVAVFDFLETVVIMLKYPVRRYLNYKARQRRVDLIQKFNRSL